MTQQFFTSIEEALSAICGDGVFPVKTERISGGDINEAYGLTTSDGQYLFLKTNRGKGEAFFAAEAAGLDAIARTGAVGTPRILGYGNAFLLLEFLHGGKRAPDYWETLGHQLADMHRAAASDYVNGAKYGFIRDNFIGEGTQIGRASCRERVSFFL